MGDDRAKVKWINYFQQDLKIHYNAKSTMTRDFEAVSESDY